jgi:hypothetical protein
MTSLPIVETQEGDVSAYIPTNVISISDGQGCLFEEGSVTSPQGRAVPGAAVLCGELHQLGLAGRHLHGIWLAVSGFGSF